VTALPDRKLLEDKLQIQLEGGVETMEHQIQQKIIPCTGRRYNQSKQ
jgi:hypothetical protein